MYWDSCHIRFIKMNKMLSKKEGRSCRACLTGDLGSLDLGGSFISIYK
jgi:hypothetical protein